MSKPTQHKPDCNMAFGRKDATCPRCIELLAGAPVRAGWQKQYFAVKRSHDAQRSFEIRNHDCKVSSCAVVCTFGDW